jgi:glycosyltransferase involved in cell wall biosynthesis
MKLSVAMCAYDGDEFIKRQLVTILKQSLSVDEIIICDDGSKDSTIEIINDYIENSQELLENQQKNKAGLTFRVFESLGLEKKLIATIKDVKNYDFYNPINILFNNIDHLAFPKTFFKTPYQPIDGQILKKYLVENWVSSIVK